MVVSEFNPPKVKLVAGDLRLRFWVPGSPAIDLFRARPKVFGNGQVSDRERAECSQLAFGPADKARGKRMEREGNLAKKTRFQACLVRGVFLPLFVDN